MFTAASPTFANCIYFWSFYLFISTSSVLSLCSFFLFGFSSARNWLSFFSLQFLLIMKFTCYCFCIYFAVEVPMELRVCLFRHLLKLIEVLGGPPPEVLTKESTTGHTKFVIFLDVSKFPHPTLPGVPTDQHGQ